MSMVERSFMGLGPHGFHRVVYYEWGDPANDRVLMCVHGMARNGRDFDFLAEALQDEWRVVCPDVPGRGKSDRLAVGTDYGYPLYLADMAALIARLDVEQVDWVGTSMGGLMGIMLAAQPNNPVRKLLANDVGPYIPKAALERIAGYVGTDPRFPDLAALEAYYREIYVPFGDLTDAQWAHLAEHGHRKMDDGTVRLHYDPAIGDPLRDLDALEDIDLWPVWDAVHRPTLVLRGADSDVLDAETAVQMSQRGPKAELIQLDGYGHAPPLMNAEQIELVRNWLRS